MHGRRFVIWSLTALMMVTATFGHNQRRHTIPAKATDRLTGSYEGIVKGEKNFPEMPIKLDIKYSGGSVSAALEVSGNVVQINSGTFRNDELVLKWNATGGEAFIIARLTNNQLIGKLGVGSEVHALALKRPFAASLAQRKAGTQQTTKAAESLSNSQLIGEWKVSSLIGGSCANWSYRNSSGEEWRPCNDGERDDFTLIIKADADRLIAARENQETKKVTITGDTISMSWDSRAPNEGPFWTLTYKGILKGKTLLGIFSSTGLPPGFSIAGAWRADKVGDAPSIEASLSGQYKGYFDDPSFYREHNDIELYLSANNGEPSGSLDAPRKQMGLSNSFRSWHADILGGAIGSDGHIKIKFGDRINGQDEVTGELDGQLIGGTFRGNWWTNLEWTGARLKGQGDHDYRAGTFELIYEKR